MPRHDGVIIAALGPAFTMGVVAAGYAVGVDASPPGLDASAWLGALSFRGDTPRRDGRFAGMSADLRILAVAPGQRLAARRT